MMRGTRKYMVNRMRAKSKALRRKKRALHSEKEDQEKKKPPTSGKRE